MNQGRRFLLDTDVCVYLLNGNERIKERIAVVGLGSIAISVLSIAMVRTDFDKKVPFSEFGIFDRQVNDPSSQEKTAPWNWLQRYSMTFRFPNRNALLSKACS